MDLTKKAFQNVQIVRNTRPDARSDLAATRPRSGTVLACATSDYGVTPDVAANGETEQPARGARADNRDSLTLIIRSA